MSQHTGITESIDGREYKVLMLSPLVSHELLSDVGKMVGPALGPVADVFVRAVQQGGLQAFFEQDLDTAFFSRLAGTLFDRWDKKTMRTVIETMKGVSYVDGTALSDVFDEVFRGELGTMYKWLAFAMKVQWGNSFGALVATISDRGAEAEEMGSVSQSRGTSTGSSGG